MAAVTPEAERLSENNGSSPVPAGYNRREMTIKRKIPVNYTLLRKCGAEFIGTFMIVFSALAGSVLDQKYNGVETLLGKALSSGLSVTIAVISTGHISKAHLNPSVTVAYATLGHFPWAHVPAFFASEFAGSICASFLIKGIYHPIMSGGVTVPSIGGGQAMVLEFVATFFLMFLITAVATDPRATGDMAAIGIGGTVVLDILIIGPLTGASMNPARSFGPALATGNFRQLWVYFIGPTAGAVSGAAAYHAVKLTDADFQS